MAKKESDRTGSHLSILELEIALLREKAAWEDWNLRVAEAELKVMKRITTKTQWAEDLQPLVDKLEAALAESRQAVTARDTTNISAAHTRLEQAVIGLRDALY